MMRDSTHVLESTLARNVVGRRLSFGSGVVSEVRVWPVSSMDYAGHPAFGMRFALPVGGIVSVAV